MISEVGLRTLTVGPLLAVGTSQVDGDNCELKS